MTQSITALAPFKHFLDALPDATLLVDEHHRILFANHEVESVFGYQPAELAAQDIDILLPPRLRDMHRQIRLKYMVNPTVRRMGSGLTLWAMHKSGREFPVEIGLSPLPTEQGELILCSIRDISHLKKTEQALINDQRFRLFMTHAPSAIAMFDRDMRYLAFSQRWLEDYRLEQQDIIGKSHYEVFPDIPQRWRDSHRRCLAGETLRDDDDLFVRADGRKEWVKWEMCPWYDNDGVIGGLILFTEVITARKEAEVLLRKSEDQFHKIFDNAVTGIAITDLAGQFQYCNNAYCTITGYSLAELRRLTFQRLIHPDDFAANLAEVQRLVTGEIASYVIENRYVAKTGKSVWVRKYGSTLPGDRKQLMVIVVDITQLKQIELDLQNSYRKLEASESLFRSLIASMPQMAWITNSDGVIGYANSQWFAYLGSSDLAESETVWFAPVHPGDHARVLLAWERATLHQASFNLECRLLNGNNSYRWWQIRVVALKNDGHTKPSWLGVCTDIHDLKREEEALDLLNTACFRLWRTDNLQEGLHEMLSATMEMLQTDMGNIQLLTSAGNLDIVAQHGFGANSLDLFRNMSPDTPSLCTVALKTGRRQIIEDVDVDPFYAPFRQAARQAGYRSVQCTPLLTPNGQPIGVISTHFRESRQLDAVESSMLNIYAQQATNFIKRCRGETLVRQSEEHFRSIFDNALVGISVRDKDGNLLDCNTAYRNLLGYSREELHQLPLDNVMHADDVPSYLHHFQQLHLGNVPFFQIEVRYICKSGLEHWVNQYVSILHRQNGDQEQVLTIVSDIGPLKRSQAELSNRKKFLESAIASRTHELNQARITAEKANAFKTRFLSAAGHDLRQPLQSASLYLSVLAKRLEASDCKSICDDLRESMAMMGSILDELLDISRLESGFIVPSKRDFSLGDMFDRLAVTTVPQAASKRLKLEYQKDECFLYSDPALLERILGNFVSNAIKYTEHGRITVSCSCDGSVARILVEDTGIGIAADKLRDIFDAYYQVTTSKPQRDSGLGLGLAIVKHIADILELKLEVVSNPGVGSVFSVAVPLGKPIVAANNRPAKPNLGNHCQANVLFIDDDPAICKAVKLLFETQGIKGHFAQSGETALRAITDGLKPALIVTDYQLPGLNGVETVSAIRAAIGTDLPALIVTGNLALSKSLGKRLGNCRAFPKPLAPDRLLELIASYLPDSLE